MCLFRYTLLFPQKHPTVFAKTPWCFVFGTFLVSFAKVEFFGTITRTTKPLTIYHLPFTIYSYSISIPVSG